MDSFTGTSAKLIKLLSGKFIFPFHGSEQSFSSGLFFRFIPFKILHSPSLRLYDQDFQSQLVPAERYHLD